MSESTTATASLVCTPQTLPAKTLPERKNTTKLQKFGIYNIAYWKMRNFLENDVFTPKLCVETGECVCVESRVVTKSDIEPLLARKDINC